MSKDKPTNYLILIIRQLHVLLKMNIINLITKSRKKILAINNTLSVLAVVIITGFIKKFLDIALRMPMTTSQAILEWANAMHCRYLTLRSLGLT